MKLTLKNLKYPGLFAQIGESGYVEVFSRTEDISVRGVDDSGSKFDRSYKSFDKLLEDNPHLNDLDFIKTDEGLLTTRKLQAVIAKVLAYYGGFVGDVRVHSWERDVIDSIKLRFPPETWADLINKEGTLLPACCASISEIRDQLINALREDGWINGESLETIVVNMSSHDFADDSPIKIVANIFGLIKDHVNLREPATENPLDPADACSMIYHFAAAYSWSSITSSFGNFESRTCLVNDIFNTIPALHTLYGKIRELDPGPIEGYALMDRVKGEVYKFASGGIAMFTTLDDAKGLAERWIKSKQVKASRLDIKAVRISVQNGIEFLDSVDNPFIDPNRMIPELDGEDREVAERVCKELDKCEEKIKNKEVKIALRVAKRDIEKIKNRRNPGELVDF